MIALVDTSVWSLAFRRSSPSQPAEAQELAELIREGRAAIIGPIRQELLSGIKHKPQFELLKRRLRSFPDVELTVNDFELAAEYFNRCRAVGIQGSNTDFLICAVAHQRRQSVFTADADFQRFATTVPVALHATRV